MAKTMLDGLDTQDAINRLYLATLGHTTGEPYAMVDVADYVTYIRELTKSMNYEIADKRSPGELPKTISKTFFENLSKSIDKTVKQSNISEESLLSLIQQIKNGDIDSTLTLTSDQFNLLYSGDNKTELIDYFITAGLPKITRLDRTFAEALPDDLVEALTSFQLDEHFARTYRVKNVYDITYRKRRRRDASWKKITGVHGTKNKSLVDILSQGFKLASELRKYSNDNANFSYTGSGLGDCIYFTTPNHVGKASNYTGSRNDTVYLIIADLFYQEKKDIHDHRVQKYNGKNLVFAHSVGRFSKNELGVMPKQIDIKYVVEIERKR